MEFPEKRVCVSCYNLRKEFNNCDDCFRKFLFGAIQKREQFDFEFIKEEIEKINIKLIEIESKIK